MPLVPINPGLFAILGQSNFDKIALALQDKYPNEFYPLTVGQWLLAAPGKTTQEVSETLGISGEPSIASAVVLAFNNYFGRANPQIWEWIAAKSGAQRA